MSKIKKASNLELIIELMYMGQSGIVESLADEEPIDIDEITAVLSARTGRPKKADFDDWYSWYLGNSSGESDVDKEILRNLADFKSKFDDIVKRIRNR